MDDTALLLTHMDDLARQAQKTGMAHSKFLTAAEAAAVQAAFARRRDVCLALDGGFEGAERQVAVFTQPDWGVYTRGEVLAALALRHRPQDEIAHREVLGAVLGLGLSREVLGDILILPDRALLVCLAGMSGFITAELCKVARVGVTVEPAGLEALPNPAAELEEKPATVASLRLDAVLAAAFALSRTAAGQAIRAGQVQLAHRECLDPAKTVQPGNILSLRGKGRVRLLRVEDTPSRKGRLRILLGLYGRAPR